MRLFGSRGKDERESGQQSAMSYRDWSLWFEAFEQAGEDDALLEKARRHSALITAGTADNFSRRAAEAMSARLNNVGKMLEGGLQRSRTEQDALRSILNARQSFADLVRFAELPCWPESLKSRLRSLIEHHVSERQNHLLESARSDRSGVLTSMLSKNRLDAFQTEPRERDQSMAAAQASAGSSRRNILF